MTLANCDARPELRRPSVEVRRTPSKFDAPNVGAPETLAVTAFTRDAIGRRSSTRCARNTKCDGSTLPLRSVDRRSSGHDLNY
jgi:hypothetical protein